MLKYLKLLKYWEFIEVWAFPFKFGLSMQCIIPERKALFVKRW